MFGWRKSKRIEGDLLRLINLAGQLGLNEKDITISKEYLEYNEPGLSLDQLITQLYEYNVEISTLFYSMVVDIAAKLELPTNEYDFLQLLIKRETL